MHGVTFNRMTDKQTYTQNFLYQFWNILKWRIHDFAEVAPQPIILAFLLSDDTAVG